MFHLLLRSRKALTYLCILFSLTLTAPSWAAFDQDPYQLMQQVADQTFQRIATDQAQIARDTNHLKVIVTEQLMPYIDHVYAAKLILYKINASPEQKTAFYQAFESYLITTYATVFAKYTDQKVVFEPSQPFADKKNVTVKTHLLSTGLPDIDIDFKVRKITQTGQWRAYDLKAMGISLLDAKRSELSGLLRQPNGVNTVTRLLTEKAKADIIADKQVSQL